MTWVCVCNHAPCDGLDCGVPIPGRAPRRRPPPKTPEQLSAWPASRFAFVGRPDADGWMPWSGGENPVPGRAVELQLKWGITSGVYASEEIDWSCHCRFRLAPTAPVEASGSEDMRRREITAVMTALDSFAVLAGRVTATQAEHVLASLDVLRPQPSGETREIVEEWAAMARRATPPTGCLLRYVPISEGEITAIEALLSARPLALGGQHSGGEDRLSAALIAMVEHFERVDASAEDKSAIQAACEVWADVKRAKALSTTPARAEAPSEDDARRSLIQRIEQWDRETEYSAEDIASLADDILHEFNGAPVVARAEAQDEGAAGHDSPITAAIRAKLARVKATTYRAGTPAERMKEGKLDGLNTALAIAMVEDDRARAHPSPPPAADADRVRAWDAFAAHSNWELSHGYPDGEEEDGCWLVHSVNGGRNDREWTEIGRGETPLDAAIAALKSTAAKEGEKS